MLRIAMAGLGCGAWVFWYRAGTDLVRAARFSATGDLAVKAPGLWVGLGGDAYGSLFGAGSLGGLGAVAIVTPSNDAALTDTIAVNLHGDVGPTGATGSLTLEGKVTSPVTVLGSKDGAHLLLAWVEQQVAMPAANRLRVARFDCVAP